MTIIIEKIGAIINKLKTKDEELIENQHIRRNNEREVNGRVNEWIDEGLRI